MSKPATEIPMQPEAEDALDRFLIGQDLEGGWTIKEARDVARDAPSRSRTYLARNAAGEHAFVKVLDPRGLNTVAEHKLALDEFAYEDSLVHKCRTKKLRRVIRGLHSSQIMLPGEIPVAVRYLVFEWAHRDMRSVPELDEKNHTVSSLYWLRHTATALQELHNVDIVHQDLKPANVLLMHDSTARVGDLGRAQDRTAPRPGEEVLRGSAWAAPEVLYGAFGGGHDARRAVDMYQLGSLIIYLFSSVGLTTRLSSRILPIHHWQHWFGSYPEVLVYLRDYYGQVLLDWQADVPEWLYPELKSLVAQLTDPDPALRGHPHNRAGHGTRYGFERYISAFDALYLKAKRR